MDCTDGLGSMTVYQVYPGIQFIYNDFEATSCDWKENLEMRGDLSIRTMDNCSPEMSFPLKHYRGISVVINLKKEKQR